MSESYKNDTTHSLISSFCSIMKLSQNSCKTVQGVTETTSFAPGTEKTNVIIKL